MSPIEGATITVRGEASLRADPDEALLWVQLSEVENTSGRSGPARRRRRCHPSRHFTAGRGTARLDQRTALVRLTRPSDSPRGGAPGGGRCPTKADAYASGVSADLGALITLVEPERPGGSTLRLGRFAPLSGTDTAAEVPAEAAQLEVTAAIDATFELRRR